MSNFYPSIFEVNKVKYTCNEQYIMAQKALVFDDKNAYKKILETTSPTIMKKYGRAVKNFTDDAWLKVRDKILYDGLYAKFSQNEKLKKLLLETNNKILVEASKMDKIYGVGLSEDNDLILDEKNWRGQNLLGKTLMLIRAKLF
jgi:ribA/ribD-fused uncharacterized protein